MQILVGIFLIMTSISFASGSDEELALKIIRADLNAILQSEGKINYSLASLKQSRTATAKAYQGLLRSTSASFAAWPGEKLKRFNEGKLLIEQAVNESAGQAEVRLIRLMVQCNCPSFLGYSSHINEDINQISKSLQGTTLSSVEKKYIAEKLFLVSCVKEPLKKELRNYF
jgi:hypothetical protein